MFGQALMAYVSSMFKKKNNKNNIKGKMDIFGQQLWWLVLIMFWGKEQEIACAAMLVVLLEKTKPILKEIDVRSYLNGILLFGQALNGIFLFGHA